MTINLHYFVPVTASGDVGNYDKLHRAGVVRALREQWNKVEDKYFHKDVFPIKYTIPTQEEFEKQRPVKLIKDVTFYEKNFSYLALPYSDGPGSTTDVSVIANRVLKFLQNYEEEQRLIEFNKPDEEKRKVRKYLDDYLVFDRNMFRRDRDARWLAEKLFANGYSRVVFVTNFNADNDLQSQLWKMPITVTLINDKSSGQEGIDFTQTGVELVTPERWYGLVAGTTEVRSKENGRYMWYSAQEAFTLFTMRKHQAEDEAELARVATQAEAEA